MLAKLITVSMAVSACFAQPFAYLGYRYGSAPQSGAVRVINTTNFAVAGTVELGKIQPGWITFLPDGSAGYAGGGGMPAIAVFASTLLNTIALPDIPGAADIVPDGSTLYAVYGGEFVAAINTASNSVSDTVDLGGGIGAGTIAITPDGINAYVAITGGLAVIDTDPNSPTYHTLLATIPLNVATSGIAFTPDGAKAYLATSGGLLSLNLTTYDTTPILNLGTRDLFASVDGGTVYAASTAGNWDILAVDTGADQVSNHFPPHFLRMASGGDRIYGVAQGCSVSCGPGLPCPTLDLQGVDLSSTGRVGTNVWTIRSETFLAIVVK